MQNSLIFQAPGGPIDGRGGCVARLKKETQKNGRTDGHAMMTAYTCIAPLLVTLVNAHIGAFVAPKKL